MHSTLANSKQRKGAPCQGTLSSPALRRRFASSSSASLSFSSRGSSRASLSPSANCLRSPLFVFALSNAIIAALLAQSSRLTAADRSRSPSQSHPSAPPRTEAEGEAEHRHNHVTDRAETDRCRDKDSGAAADSDSRRVDRRCQSEKLEGEGEGEDGRKAARRKLRRSETEKARESLYTHDKLSNEEFRRTVEAFIAKQMRFLREESLAIIVQTSEQTNNLRNR